MRHLELDEVLAYRTPKISVLKDWRLGALHWFVRLSVLVYFVVYQLCITERYLDLQPVVGKALMWIKHFPSGFQSTTPFHLPYCVEYTGLSTDYKQRYSCKQMPYEWLGSGLDWLLIPTRFHTREYNMTCLWNDGQDCNVRSPDSFVPEIENMLIHISHAATAAGSSKRFIQSDHQGRLLFKDGSVEMVERGKRDTGGVYDQFTLSLLLRAAGIHMDEKLRDSGVTLALKLHYSHDWLGRFAGYTYSVNDLDFITKEYSFNDAAGIAAHKDGVLVQIVRSGRVGEPSFHAFMVALAASAALANVGPLLLEVVMKHSPNKKHYKKIAWEQSVQFSEVRATHITPEEHIRKIWREAYGDREENTGAIYKQVERLKLSKGEIVIPESTSVLEPRAERAAPQVHDVLVEIDARTKLVEERILQMELRLDDYMVGQTHAIDKKLELMESQIAATNEALKKQIKLEQTAYETHLAESAAAPTLDVPVETDSRTKFLEECISELEFRFVADKAELIQAIYKKLELKEDQTSSAHEALEQQFQTGNAAYDVRLTEGLGAMEAIRQKSILGCPRCVGSAGELEMHQCRQQTGQTDEPRCESFPGPIDCAHGAILAHIRMELYNMELAAHQRLRAFGENSRKRFEQQIAIVQTHGSLAKATSNCDDPLRI